MGERFDEQAVSEAPALYALDRRGSGTFFGPYETATRAVIEAAHYDEAPVVAVYANETFKVICGCDRQDRPEDHDRTPGCWLYIHRLRMRPAGGDSDD